jgi:integrase
VEVVLDELRRGEVWAPRTVVRVAGGMGQFARFVERGHGATCLDEVTQAMVRSWVDAMTSEGAAPSDPVRYMRRASVRLLYRTARRLGLATGDPSIDVVLPPWQTGRFRPLEIDEVELCRSIAMTDPRDRRPVAWALCEATARSGELSAVRRADVDLEPGRVWLAGTTNVDPRWGVLTSWGARQIARRLASLPPDPETPLLRLRPGDPVLRLGSAQHLIGEVLTRAGLHHTAGVRPNSIVGWTGRALFDETGRIDLVAARCGVRSLDSAARLIGWDWRASDE